MDFGEELHMSQTVSDQSMMILWVGVFVFFTKLVYVPKIASRCEIFFLFQQKSLLNFQVQLLCQFYKALFMNNALLIEHATGLSTC